jgi:hypothetical protein
MACWASGTELIRTALNIQLTNSFLSMLPSDQVCVCVYVMLIKRHGFVVYNGIRGASIGTGEMYILVATCTPYTQAFACNTL